jgi:AraC-like DNA-binding protein
MIFHKHIPASPLSSYVDCMVYVEGNNKGAGLPKTAMSLVFNLNDSFKLFTDSRFAEFTDYKKYWVAGLQTQPSYVESYGESKMLVIQFKNLGAHAFLHQPLHYFTNSYVNLDCVFKTEAETVWQQLKEAKTIAAQFAVAEQFLNRRLLQSKPPALRLVAAVDLLFSNSSSVSITDICREYNMSRKHLGFLFHEYLGLSPKLMSSLHRFQQILRTISNTRPGKLSHLAYEMDFFDQAHFNNNFKRFTGLRPNDYIRHAAVEPSLKLVPHFLPAE